MNAEVLPSSADAVTMSISWANVEPTSGIWNWNTNGNHYDDELADIAGPPGTDYGKKAIIILYYLQDSVNNCSTTTRTAPQYVWTHLGVSEYGCYTDSAGKSLLLPNYRYGSFITDWQNYVSAVATHFASSTYASDIVYIRGMMGKGGETMPCGPDAWNSTTVGMVVNGATATTCHAAYGIWWNSGGYVYDYGFWEDWLYTRLGDEEADFSYTYVVASVDNWDNNQLKWPCSYPGTGTCDYHNYWIYEAVSGGGGQTVVGSNALPHDTGQVRELDAAISANITTTVHYEFQESQAATQDSDTTTEATAAWCFSESDTATDDGDGTVTDVTSVEWYKSDWTNSYTTGITDIPSWEDGTTDPTDPDSTFCSGY